MDSIKLLLLILQNKQSWQQLPPELQAVLMQLATDCLDDIKTQIGEGTGSRVLPEVPEPVKAAVGGLVKSYWDKHGTGVGIGTIATAVLGIVLEYLKR